MQDGVYADRVVGGGEVETVRKAREERAAVAIDDGRKLARILADS